MSHAKYGLLCLGRAIKSRINEITRLINRAITCIHYKNCKENVSKIKITKKILDIENMFKYDLGIFMHKFKKDILPVGLSLTLQKLIKYIVI